MMGQNADESPPNTRLTRGVAAMKIERCWCSYRDRQMFKLLKYAICAAEHSLTFEVLRKVSPLEAELLRDPAVHARVRFRFGGTEFPPIILFKIYIHSGGQGVKYYSGKKVIKPASEAACDSLKLMGNRRFYDQMIADMCQNQQDRVTDEVDVTTMKDYMQYLSHLDECPPEVGGKSNFWRRLTLDAIPRQIIVHDIFNFVESGIVSSKLRDEMPDLLNLRPVTQEAQVASIRALSYYRNKKWSPDYTGSKSTARRTRKAKDRVAKMKRMYGMGSPQLGNEDGNGNGNGNDFSLRVDYEDIFEDDWEEQADKLYEWTQKLSVEDLAVSP